MPQEISVSYQAIKSKVYRLIDSLVVGEKSESEVQESIRRWWSLIHPPDRHIAQKYLLLVLGRSATALDSMGDALLSVSTCEVARPQMADSPLPGKRMRLVERMVQERSVRTAVSARPSSRRHRIYNPSHCIQLLFFCIFTSSLREFATYSQKCSQSRSP